ncbi:MAG: ParA family protein [Candidatus Paceibacterota bacterium]|jgi:chromosome partitioning protein
MARVIAVCNQKGGVGKTTTAMNLAAYLAILGNRTLLIDFDPQFNATVGLGVTHAPDETIYHALLAGKVPEHTIKRTHLANLDLVPASSDLAGALIELVGLADREYVLRNFVTQVSPLYDFILIDLPPSLNLLTINGLLAAGEVIIPVQCEYYSLEGLSQLLQTVTLIRDNLDHPLKIGGALLTMYDKREKLSREVAREVRRRFPHHVYDIEIPRSVSLAEAPSFHKPVVLHAPQSSGALAYERLAREVAMQFEDPMTVAAAVHAADASSKPIEKITEAIAESAETIPIRSEYFPEERPLVLFDLSEIIDIPPYPQDGENLG